MGRGTIRQPSKDQGGWKYIRVWCGNKKRWFSYPTGEAWRMGDGTEMYAESTYYPDLRHHSLRIISSKRVEESVELTDYLKKCSEEGIDVTFYTKKGAMVAKDTWMLRKYPHSVYAENIRKAYHKLEEVIKSESNEENVTGAAGQKVG